ncbi:unnamed protein product [Penicillium pancosmium]
MEIFHTTKPNERLIIETYSGARVQRTAFAIPLFRHHLKICIAPLALQLSIPVITKDRVQFDLKGIFLVGFRDSADDPSVAGALRFLCVPSLQRNKAMNILEYPCNRERITGLVKGEVCAYIATNDIGDIVASVRNGSFQADIRQNLHAANSPFSKEYLSLEAEITDQ